MCGLLVIYHGIYVYHLISRFQIFTLVFCWAAFLENAKTKLNVTMVYIQASNVTLCVHK